MEAEAKDTGSPKAVKYSIDTKLSEDEMSPTSIELKSPQPISRAMSKSSSTRAINRSYSSSPKFESIEKRSVFIVYNEGEPDVAEKVNMLRKRLVAKDKVVYLNPVSIFI